MKLSPCNSNPMRRISPSVIIPSRKSSGSTTRAQFCCLSCNSLRASVIVADGSTLT
uniref:Uncharacterized protein n=1 Tax=Arundo donax TaxID=35708 RepID=A0A0A9ARZ4_ARUDO